MAGKLRSLQRLIPSDPHLWIALVVAAIFIVLEILQKLHGLGEPLMVGLSVIMICIIMLVADRLKEGDKVWEKVCDNTEKLARIAQSTSNRCEIALRSCPKKAEDYDYLWGGYTKTYYVYNPSYKVDTRTGKDQTVQTFMRRYQHPRFDKAQYLFLTQDDDGQNALKTFRELMVEVQKTLPDVRKKVEVKQNPKKAACSAPEMYLGERDGEPIGVLELKKPTLMQQHGEPQYYLIIHDGKVVDDYISDHFSEWNDSNAEEVHFWDD